MLRRSILTRCAGRTPIPHLALGGPITVRGRVTACREKGKISFLLMRDPSGASVQGVFAGPLPKGVRPESIVEVHATVVAATKPVASATHTNIELQVGQLEVVSEAREVLPFQLADANVGGNGVQLETRLNARVLDLRSGPTKSAMLASHTVTAAFREFMGVRMRYIEIHTPKIIPSTSEGGANIFKLDYFGSAAFLAQSPQLYKQMALQGDLGPGVFEVGPVFRAENSNTHRHLTEFTGLDVEMILSKDSHEEVMDVAEDLCGFIFEKLQEGNPNAPPFVFKTGPRCVRVTFAEALALLQINDGRAVDQVVDDFDTPTEKRLGDIIKQKHGVDFFFIHKYHSNARPFYTKECSTDRDLTNSFDIIMRGEEICSGSQRIHDVADLMARGARKGIDMGPLKDYVETFRLGAWPHGGFGIGLERVVMLYLKLGNIRNASMFPRDPKRVTP